MKISIIIAAFALFPSFAKAQDLCPDSHHPHVIDLGLPSGTKWACCNVGSSKPEGYGSYFAWGEAFNDNYFNLDNYVWYNRDKLTKYNTVALLGAVDNRTQLELSDDAAHRNWHGAWRMPTIAEMTELIDNCSYTWTTIKRVKGGLFTSRSNGCSIFLPASGWCNGLLLNGRGEFGYYWSSSLFESDPDFAHYLLFRPSGTDTNANNRYVGRNVRPVLRN